MMYCRDKEDVLYGSIFLYSNESLGVMRLLGCNLVVDTIEISSSQEPGGEDPGMVKEFIFFILESLDLGSSMSGMIRSAIDGHGPL
jgi:hypothetical protein